MGSDTVEPGVGWVRRMRENEKTQLRRVMRACFGWFPSLFFDAGNAAFVYELDGRIAGGITLSSFPIDAERTGGIVKWLFVLPATRGRGAASALVDHALAWFAEQGCTDLFSCVEGHNTDSSNRFAGAGFRILSFSDQVRQYGLRLPRVWFRTFHMMDVGLFLWACRPQKAERESAEMPAQPTPRQRRHPFPVGLVGTVLVLILAGVLMAWRQGAALSASTLLHLVLVTSSLIVIRTGAMVLMARHLRLSVQYRPWETGLLLSVIVPLVSSGVFVAPGGLYPSEARWRYREWLPKLGPIALAAAGALMLTGWGLQAARWTVVSEATGPLLDLALFYTRALLLFDVLLVFFPFEGFNGRRILQWRFGVWAVMAALTVALWVLGYVVGHAGGRIL